VSKPAHVPRIDRPAEVEQQVVVIDNEAARTS
jgi:hypothetical protein